MKWLEDLNQAIEYVENNLDKDISYDKAARIACCSTYYFQRIFSYIVGISLSEYIRRRRMTQAAFELQNTDVRILDVALKYGYASPTSFNRAFQKIHGIPPVAAKNKSVTLQAYPPVKLSLKISGANPISYRIEEKEAIRIVGLQTPLGDNMEINQKHIPQFWESTIHHDGFKTICALANQKPKGILGLSLYIDPQNIFYYIACTTHRPKPKGMYEHKIPAATWVVFKTNGCFKKNVQNIFKRFYTEWLPNSGYIHAGLPDIEVYPIQKPELQSGYLEVWIAITKEKELNK